MNKRILSALLFALVLGLSVVPMAHAAPGVNQQQPDAIFVFPKDGADIRIGHSVGKPFIAVFLQNGGVVLPGSGPPSR